MSNFKFSESSIKKLNTVDPRLKKLAIEVLKVSPFDFAITCGLRTQQEQMQMYVQKKSRCDGIKDKSKHQANKNGVSEAIDIMVYDENGKGTWEKKYYIEIAKVFKQKAEELNIGIMCGVDFKNFFDGPHIEII